MIYRLLEVLRAAGWITRVQSYGEQHTYARLLPGHHHSLICTQCGTTLVIGGCDIEDALAPTIAQTDFEVHGHLLEHYGLGGRCRLKQPSVFSERT